jgi:hypothetical protein
LLRRCHDVELLPAPSTHDLQPIGRRAQGRTRGKTALAAHLVWTRPCVHHFTRLEGASAPEQARRSLAAQLIGAWQLTEQLAPGDSFPAVADRPDWLSKVLWAAADKRIQMKLTEPIVLVVDGLDEADPPAPGQDTGIPLGLPRPDHLPDGVFVLVTSRFGQPMTPLHEPESWHTIEVDGEDNQTDMQRYLSDLVEGDRPLEALVGQLGANAVDTAWFVNTLAERCAGVWIYMRYVLDAILSGQRSPANLDALPARLAGYYLEQIQRWNRLDAWRAVGLPTLATLAALRRPVAQAELERLAGAPTASQRVWLDQWLRPFLDVTHDAQRRRHWPIRHQSLRDLFQPDDTLDVRSDAGIRDMLTEALAEAHRQIATSLIPAGREGDRAWDDVDHYTRTALPEHAAAAGLLDELIQDPGFLLTADAPALLRVGSALATEDGRASLAAYQLSLGQWPHQDAAARAWHLHLWARKAQAERLASAAGRHAKTPWTVEHALWGGMGHHMLSGHEGEVHSVAVGRVGGREMVVSGGRDGTVRVWEPGSEAAPVLLSGHQGSVLSVAVGRVGRREVVVSGGVDGTVRVWEPGSEAAPVLLSGHQGPVYSVAVGRVGGREVVVSAGEDGAVLVWCPKAQPAGNEADQLT